MKTLRTMLVMALSASVLVACDDDDDPTDPVDDNDNAELVGTFEATDIEFTDVNDPDNTVDLVDEGSTFDLTLNDDNTFEARFDDATTGMVETTGTFNATASEIEFSDDPFLNDDVTTPRVFGFTRDAFLTLSDTDSSWDIDGNGLMDDSEMLVRFNN